MSNTPKLPRGVKRHLLNNDSALVMSAMLTSPQSITAYDIGQQTKLPRTTITGRLHLMHDLGIVSIERTPACIKWSIPISYIQPLRDYMQELK